MGKSQDDIIEELLIAIEGAANIMRGMLLDTSIPNHAKEAMEDKISDLDSIINEHALK